MKEKLKMVLLNTKDNTIRKVMVDDELNEFYRLLDCNCIDIVERKVGEEYYDIICDDEGLLKSDPSISAIKIKDNGAPEPMLVGNLLFCRSDTEGNTIALSDEDCDAIERHSAFICDRDGHEHIVSVLGY